MSKKPLTFSRHGQCQIDVEPHLVYIKATGPWNVEFFHDMHQQLANAATQTLDLTNYATILEPRGEALAVEEAMNLHIAFLQKIQCKAVAIVMQDCLTPAITQKMCSKIYNAVNMPHAFFNDLASAKQWLESNYLTNT